MLNTFVNTLLSNILVPSSSFLGDIRDSFLGRAKVWSDTPMILMGVLALALALLVAMIAISQVRKRQHYIPHGWLTDPKQIGRVLDMAVEQRSTFELQFPGEASKRRPVLRCTPASSKGPVMTLEAFGVQQFAEEWKDREVEAYFKISSAGQFIYYAVNTKIAGIRISAGERCAIVLDPLEQLDNRQKRAFLRIIPPEEYLLGAALWFREQPEDDVMSDATLWPKPDLMILQGKVQQFEIADLSAGGSRLRIDKHQMEGWGHDIRVSDRVFILLSLLDPDEHKRLRFWMQCRVQNIALDSVTHVYDMGLQFLAWATVRESSGTTMEWLKLARNLEVDPLGNWVIRRHLEMFRESPQALS